MSEKLKLYIDTSVWNFALETTRPDSFLTYEFLLNQYEENHELIISSLVKSEIDLSHEPRKSDLIRLIQSFNTFEFMINEESTRLANIYLKEQLLPKSSINDAIHIALATVNRCNFIVSWNFKHIVRAKVIRGVHLINHKEGYGLIDIVSPREFMGK